MEGEKEEDGRREGRRWKERRKKMEGEEEEDGRREGRRRKNK